VIPACRTPTKRGRPFAALQPVAGKAVAGNVVVCGPKRSDLYIHPPASTARAFPSAKTQDKIDERLDETLNRAKVSGRRNRVMFATRGAKRTLRIRIGPPPPGCFPGRAGRTRGHRPSFFAFF